MRRYLFIAAALMAAACCETPVGVSSSLRAPSYPLVTFDTYFNAWSPSDTLYTAGVEHWTGKPFPFVGVLTVDGVPYRFLGRERTESYSYIAAGALDRPWDGAYTLSKPSGEWYAADFDASGWTSAPGAYGPEWRKYLTTTFLDVDDIWMRREVELPKLDDGREVCLHVTSSRESEFFVNGIRIDVPSGKHEGEYFPLPAEVMESLKSGHALLAGHSFDDEGGGRALIDMGLYYRDTFEERYPSTAVQTSAMVLPTRTVYAFQCGPVDLELTFMAPFLPGETDLTARPVDYISWSVKSRDSRRHEVALRLEAGHEWCQNYAMDEVAKAETYEKGGLRYARTGNAEQTVLGRCGDNIRIDWGYLYLASEDGEMESADNGDIAFTRALGKVARSSGMVMIGYDALCSLQYFGENLRPWWNADGTSSIEEQFEAALGTYPTLMRRCAKFDVAMMKEATEAGGQKYAELCALAYRQAFAAHTMVKSPSGNLLWVSKENNSNGCTGTVDVTYPSAPVFLLYNLDLAKGLLNHIFEYSEIYGWDKPFPCHDIGKYPLANGQHYPGDMPVEEDGNMLILTAAVCHYAGDASYAAGHWETLTRWVEYLREFGLDPEDQLCTDDFAGKSAHNVNLSIKAILGIASYGHMAEMLGKTEVAEEYLAEARRMALQWVEMAGDGDHYRLCFDRPGTWSLKYNLVWDGLLGLNVFPEGIMSKEIPYCLSQSEKYGVPLDCREKYTKTDWVVWTATMADSLSDFEAMVDPLWDFYNEQTTRVPMSDWPWTDRPEHKSFKARSPVGGVFIRLLKK